MVGFFNKFDFKFYSEINALLKKYDQFVRKLEMTSGISYKKEETATSEDSILPGNEESLHLFDEHMQVRFFLNLQLGISHLKF